MDDEHPVMQVADDEIYLVVNAGCREKDLNHLNKHLEKYQVCLPSSNRFGLPQNPEGWPLRVWAFGRHPLSTRHDTHFQQCACCAVNMMRKDPWKVFTESGRQASAIGAPYVRVQ